MMRGSVLPVLVELALWVGAASVFLASYMAIMDVGGQTVQAHGEVLAIPFLVWALIRIVPSVLGISASASASITFALMGALLIAIVLGYQALVLLGLQSWGRVITWPMAIAYVPQIRALLEALGLGLLPTLGACLLFVTSIAWIGLASQRGVATIIGPVAPGQRRPWGWFIVGVVLLTALQSWKFIQFPRVDLQEPVALTFFPDYGRAGPQNSTPVESPVQRAIDLEERARLVGRRIEDAPNIILIVGDALRSDAFSFMGNPRRTSPSLDALVERGHLVWAGPMHSICAESFCGLMGLAKSRSIHRLTSPALSLTDVLRAHGYAIKFLLGGDHTNFYGLAEAFGEADLYRDGSTAAEYMNDDELVVRYTNELDRFSGRPVFIQYHLMSTHGLGARSARYRVFEPALNYYNQIALRSAHPASRDAAARNFYDNGVLQFDSIVQRVLHLLEAKGYLDSAVVIITGDHGEHLGEQGLFGHANSVFESALRVPGVVLSFPGKSDVGLVASTPGRASIIDIAPTVAGLVGFESPVGWEGRDLLGGDSGASSRILYFAQGKEAGVIHAGAGSVRKYWLDYGEREDFLFDLLVDPDESRNLVGSALVPPDALLALQVDAARIGSAVRLAEASFVEVEGAH